MLYLTLPLYTHNARIRTQARIYAYKRAYTLHTPRPDLCRPSVWPLFPLFFQYRLLESLSSPLEWYYPLGRHANQKREHANDSLGACVHSLVSSVLLRCEHLESRAYPMFVHTKQRAPSRTQVPQASTSRLGWWSSHQGYSTKKLGWPPTSYVKSRLRLE